EKQYAVAAAALNSLGKIHITKGNLKHAKAAFKQAVAILESVWSPIASDEFRISLFGNSLEPYESLLTIALDQAQFPEAFRWAEAARARSLVESMGEDISRKSSDKLQQKLAGLREELNWFYKRLDQVEGDTKPIKKEIDVREKSIAALTRR